MLEVVTKCQDLTGEAELEAQKCLDDIDLDEDGKVSAKAGPEWRKRKYYNYVQLLVGI